MPVAAAAGRSGDSGACGISDAIAIEIAPVETAVAEAPLDRAALGTGPRGGEKPASVHIGSRRRSKPESQWCCGPSGSFSSHWLGKPEIPGAAVALKC